ncbi:sensor domain-containing protein [Planomonospora algeriensis]
MTGEADVTGETGVTGEAGKTGETGRRTPAGSTVPAGALPARFRAARSWPRPRAGEIVFALAGFPVALLGLLLVLLGTYAGGLLALTVVGLPVIAGELRAARLTGRLHRKLLRSLLDVRIEEPAGIAASPTAVAWVRAGLTDPVG